MSPPPKDSTVITRRPDTPLELPHNTTKRGTDRFPAYRPSPDDAIQRMPLDDAAMLELHEWLNRWRFRLFGRLRPCDRQDAIEETFVRTLEFAPKMRNPDALRSASLTIGLRIRAKRIEEYIHERERNRPHMEPVVSWNPERHLYERSRRKRALAAISGLRSEERELLQRFYFEGQSPEQIRDEMQLTETQFRLRKSRAIKKAGFRTRPMTIHALRFHSAAHCQSPKTRSAVGPRACNFVTLPWPR